MKKKKTKWKCARWFCIHIRYSVNAFMCKCVSNEMRFRVKKWEYFWELRGSAPSSKRTVFRLAITIFLTHTHRKKTAISLIMSVIQAFRFDFLKLFFSLLNQLSSRWIFFFLNFNGSDVFVFFSFISYSRSFCPFTSQIGNKLRKINKHKNHSHAKIECNRSAERKRIKWHKNEMSRIKCFFFLNECYSLFRV